MENVDEPWNEAKLGKPSGPITHVMVVTKADGTVTSHDVTQRVADAIAESKEMTPTAPMEFATPEGSLVQVVPKTAKNEHFWTRKRGRR